MPAHHGVASPQEIFLFHVLRQLTRLGLILSQVSRIGAVGAELWIPTLTANTRLGWGTHFRGNASFAKGNRRSFDSAQDDKRLGWIVLSQVSRIGALGAELWIPTLTANTRLGWGTHGCAD